MYVTGLLCLKLYSYRIEIAQRPIFSDDLDILIEFNKIERSHTQILSLDRNSLNRTVVELKYHRNNLLSLKR